MMFRLLYAVLYAIFSLLASFWELLWILRRLTSGFCACMEWMGSIICGGNMVKKDFEPGEIHLGLRHLSKYCSLCNRWGLVYNCCTR